MLSPDKNGNGRQTSGEPSPRISARTTPQTAEVIALQALIWVLSDEKRADRLLSLTGLDADQLRNRAGDPALLLAVIDFLAMHEPDLMACAQALSLSPEQLMQTAGEIAR